MEHNKYCNFCGSKSRSSYKKVNGFVVCRKCTPLAKKHKRKEPKKEIPVFSRILKRLNKYLIGISE